MTGGRRARISRRPDGSAIGAAVFLTADDLDALGVDPDAADVVDVDVVDGEIQLTAAPATTDAATGPPPDDGT